VGVCVLARYDATGWGVGKVRASSEPYSPDERESAGDIRDVDRALERWPHLHGVDLYAIV
jgi:hypothetical protein